MKPQYKDIITRATFVFEGHHEMEFGSIKQELADLEAKLLIAEEELIEREDECEADSEDISTAIKAIQAVQDVAEYHHGSLAQL
jgi:hypothetical protein